MSRTHITLTDLVDNHACLDQRDLFVATFGDKAKIGPRNMAKAIKAGLHVFWLERLIPAPARAEYKNATAPAWAEYEKAMAPARAEYKNATAPAWAEYEKAMAPARAEYKNATAPAWAEYEKVRASALVKALTKRGEA
ncbi:hypothetical protein [Rhodanobacter lindaniclasticus]|uniref:hypothetical protein n=1 Tax=Rhodanobacter lindaniclasticus TaxID=75310 RepID=UPI001445237D|nr:hypothetical protein [Rhodanobacter lindaniclasticus]